MLTIPILGLPEPPLRCPPESDLDLVLQEQFAYLIACRSSLTDSETDRLCRVMRILLEPFDEHATRALVEAKAA